MKQDSAADLAEAGELDPRPNTWGECKERFGDSEPCPYVSCRHHLAIDVNAVRYNASVRDPGVKVNHPHLPVWQIPETCSLRAAEQHQGMTLEHVAAHMNLTRERCRQIEAIAMAKMRGDFIPFSDDYDDHHDDGDELN